MIDEERLAVKRSPAKEFPEHVLFRRTLTTEEGDLNVQLHFDPKEALRVGRAMVEEALDLGATP